VPAVEPGAGAADEAQQASLLGGAATVRPPVVMPPVVVGTVVVGPVAVPAVRHPQHLADVDPQVGGQVVDGRDPAGADVPAAGEPAHRVTGSHRVVPAVPGAVVSVMVAVVPAMVVVAMVVVTMVVVTMAPRGVAVVAVAGVVVVWHAQPGAGDDQVPIAGQVVEGDQPADGGVVAGGDRRQRVAGMHPHPAVATGTSCGDRGEQHRNEQRMSESGTQA
jgi:hypothetical protein